MANDKDIKLTAKQRRFCHEYVLCMNATEAAIKAGYSKKTAGVMGYENLKKPYIESFIKLLQNDIERSIGVNKSMVANEFRKLAFSSIAHLHNKWIELKEFEHLTDDQKACIESISYKTRTITSKEGEDIETVFVKLKLYDKQKALENLNKMLGYIAPEKMEVKNEIIPKVSKDTIEMILEKINDVY